ncbi:hypothetical protein MKX01_030912 [Papaver californicum]|nr:hypothetical protein MKX01_030912 [Papaver californicum]
MKKSRGNGYCDQNEVNVISNTFSRRGSNFYDTDVVREILSKLPVKSLMRFKCVCKYWLFLIQEDPSFADQHLEHSKRRSCLLITNRKPKKITLMTADLLYEGKGGTISTAAVHTIREIDDTYYDRRSGPVNGMIVFFGTTIAPGVCIYNLSTREATPWIESKFFSELREKKNEHKVVGIWSFNGLKKVVCEVLTVGDNEWRKIDDVPPFNLDYWTFSSSVYVNGSIYYTTQMCVASIQDEPKFIVAFNVRSEKFRAIRVPDEAFDEHPVVDNLCISHSVKVYELDGQVALLVKLLGSVLTSKLWLFDDDDNKDASSTWTEVHMELPYTLCWGRLKFIHPVSRVDHTIITSCIQSFPGFNEIQIKGIPSSVPGFSSESRVATFVESLLPVQKQTMSSLRRKFKTIF